MTISASEVPSSFTVTEATASPPIVESGKGVGRSLPGARFATNICAEALLTKMSTADTAKNETIFFMVLPIVVVELRHQSPWTPLPFNRCIGAHFRGAWAGTTPLDRRGLA